MSTPRPLPELRSELDRLDRSLIAILAERLDVCREVARAKERTSAKIIQPTRVREIWNTRRAWAAEAHVDPSFAEQIFPITKIGMRVIVSRNNVSPTEIVHPSLPKPAPISLSAAATRASLNETVFYSR